MKKRVGEIWEGERKKWEEREKKDKEEEMDGRNGEGDRNKYIERKR